MLDRFSLGCKYAKKGGIYSLCATSALLYSYKSQLGYFFRFDAFVQDKALAMGYAVSSQDSKGDVVVCDIKYNSGSCALRHWGHEKFIFNDAIPFFWTLGLAGGFIYGFCYGQAEETKPAVTEKSESKEIVTSHKSKATSHLFRPRFHYIHLKDIMNPIGILGLDLDETILDCDLSTKTGRTILFNEGKIRFLLEEAKLSNIPVFLITARYANQFTNTFEIDETDSEIHISIKRVLQILGIEYFSGVFLTNNNPKVPVLNHLLAKYFKGDIELAPRIALADDLLHNFEGAEGFYTIPVDHKDPTYLKKIREFLKQCREQAVQMDLEREITRRRAGISRT